MPEYKKPSSSPSPERPQRGNSPRVKEEQAAQPRPAPPTDTTPAPSNPGLPENRALGGLFKGRELGKQTPPKKEK